MLEPSYGRVFFSALGKELGAGGLNIPQDGVISGAEDMAAAVDGYAGRQERPYRIEGGVAVVPVTGTLVHKMGAMRPRSGMTGYDGITANIQMAIADSGVRAVLLDIDSPGGQVAGAFDCADMIARMRQHKPIYALAGDMACSAAMLIAAACTRRFVTQTGRMGSIGVMMAHASYEEQLKQRGIDITLIYSGSHKVEGNPFEALPAGVRDALQSKMDDARQLFVMKVAGYMGISEKQIMSMEAATYDGAAAVSAGLADEMINSADVIGRIATGEGNSVSNERERVAAIMALGGEHGNDALAQALALETDVSIEQAEKLFSVAGGRLSDGDKAKIKEMATASGIPSMVDFLCNEPGMTLPLARKIIENRPVSGRAQFAKHLESHNQGDPANVEETGRLALLRGMGSHV